jgi:hypothetical protein
MEFKNDNFWYMYFQCKLVTTHVKNRSMQPHGSKKTLYVYVGMLFSVNTYSLLTGFEQDIVNSFCTNRPNKRIKVFW